MTDADDVTPSDALGRLTGAAAVAAGMSAPTAQQSAPTSASTSGTGLPVEDRNRKPVGTKEAGFAVIKRARQLLHKNVSEKTARDYKNKVALLHAATQGMPSSTQNKLLEALSAYASKPRSFYAYRAALAWFFKQQAGELLAQQDRLQKKGGHDSSWLDAVSQLALLLDSVQRVQDIKLQAASERSGTKPQPTRSKRDDLIKIERRAPDWCQLIIEASRSSKYNFPVQLLALTGCRPEELETGVMLSLDGDRVRATIIGAKLSEYSGQPWRTIGIALDGLSNELLEAVRLQGRLKIQIDSKNALRTHLRRTSERVLPQGLPAVTGYMFRHAIAENLRESGWSAEEIGALLGQAVADTQSHYGRRRRRGQRKIKPSHHVLKGDVMTAKPVRPLDRSSLAALTARQAAEKRSK